jgi:hypothetical protein
VFLVQDVGQSILESYSRVLESLAFNIIARIDDVIYVDDATKKSAAADSVSIFNRGIGVPVQKRISPSPFSIQHTPYASPFATPTFCSSTPVTGSPGRVQPPLNKDNLPTKQEVKVEKLFLVISRRSGRMPGTLAQGKTQEMPLKETERQ